MRHLFRSNWVLTLAASVVLAACGGGGDDANAVKIAGALDRPASLTAKALADQTAVTQTVSYTSGSGAQTHTYTGADLWNLLSSMGLQTDTTRRNDVLNRYVLATGSDGYRSAFALGELHPDYGNKGSLLAYARVTGGATVPLDSASDGPFRLTAPGDVKGGRYVSNLVRLDVRSSGSTAAGTGGGVSTSLAVSGAVARPMQFDLAALQALPQTTQTLGNASYSGVSLWTLLNTVTGLATDGSIKNPTIAMYAVATGSDGYKAMVSLGEVDPGFGNRGVLVATGVDGAPLSSSGFARLVVPGDLRASRSVSNLVAIEVFTAPAAQ